MLSESCRECNAPFMELKKNQTIYCVGCKKNFKREAIKEYPNEVTIVPITSNNSDPVLPIATKQTETPKDFDLNLYLTTKKR